jgi:hypothetical protein
MPRGKSLAREPLDLHAARVAEAEELRDLVESLARRVVVRRAKHAPLLRARDINEERVSAAHNEPDMRRNFRLAEKGRKKMPLEMIHREKRPPGSNGQRLRVRKPHEQRGRQSRPARRRKGIDLRHIDLCVAQRAPHDLGQCGEVIPRRNLGHDAAKFRMNLRLRPDDAREQLARAAHHGRRGFVAGSFESKNDSHRAQLFFTSGAARSV